MHIVYFHLLHNTIERMDILPVSVTCPGCGSQGEMLALDNNEYFH